MRASHSEISCYLECRRKHDFRYRKRLKVDNDQARLIQGTAVHAGLESFLRTHVDAADAPEVSAQSYRDQYCVPEPDDIAAIQASTRAGLEFLAHAEPAKILAIEEKFVVEIGGWTVPGVIDLAFEDDHKEPHVLDWKTSGKLPSDTTGTLDPQTALYAYVWMKRTGRTEIFAGRCYLRLALPKISLTKAGRVSLQSSCALSDYQAFVAANPDAMGTPADHAKALEAFAPWWRYHEDLVTLDYCEAILREWAAVAAEIELQLPPHPHHRPKFCTAYCEYVNECMDRTLNGERQENG